MSIVPVKVFYSYAHEDADLLGELKKQLAILRRNGVISEWYDGEIRAGTPWSDEIRRELDAADVVLLLISPDFINSDFCWSEEMPRALSRHEQGVTKVIAVILRPCMWESAPFAKLLVVPTDGRAVTTWNNWDEAFADVAKAIERVIRDLRPMSAGPPVPSPLGTQIWALRIFGRDSIAEAITEDFRKAQQPIVIRGFGGIGKSTLATLIAERYSARGLFATIVWIDLRDYRGSAAGENLLHKVFNQIARKVEPGSPLIESDMKTKIATVIELLSRNARRYLLIFDNYESILSAPAVNGTDVAGVLADFIASLPPSTRVLITTRDIPDLRNRVVRNLDRLDRTAADELIDARLRDQELNLSDTEIEQIHELTYGIPKLIELVVALCRAVPISQIRARIEQARVPIKQTDEVYGYLFREAFDRLYATERQVLLTMVLFTGFALPDALQEIVGVGDQAFWDVVRRLEAMSLLVVRRDTEGGMRYSIHPLTQRICDAELKRDADFDRQASSRFVAFYLACVNSNLESTLERLKLDIDNVMAAMRCAHGRAMWRDLIQFRSPVNRFLWIFGYWRQRLEADTLMLDAARTLGDGPLVANILIEDLGYTYLRFEDLDNAEACIREGLDHCERNGLDAGRALAIRHLGKAALLRAEYEWFKAGRTWEDEFAEAKCLYQQGLNIRQELQTANPNEVVSIADLKLDFGRLYWLYGRKYEYTGRQHRNAARLQRAYAYYEQAIFVSDEARSLFMACGDKQDEKRGVAKAWGNIGNARKSKGIFFRSEDRQAEAVIEFEKAEQAYRTSLDIASQIRRLDEIAHAKWGLAEVYELYGDVLPLTRRELLTKALKYAEQSHDAYRQLATPHDIRVTAALRDRIAEKLATEAPPEPALATDGFCIEAFYVSREAIPGFRELVWPARKEVAILGLALNVVAHHWRRDLEVLLRRKHEPIRIRLLMMSPIDRDGKPLPWVEEVGKVNDLHDLSDIVRGHLRDLQHWLNGLEPPLRERLQIRLYPTIPTATMLLVDGDTDDGFLKFEMLVYGVSPPERPSYLLKKSKCAELFGRLCSMLEKLWAIGIDIDEQVWNE